MAGVTRNRGKGLVRWDDWTNVFHSLINKLCLRVLLLWNGCLFFEDTVSFSAFECLETTQNCRIRYGLSMFMGLGLPAYQR